MKNNGMTNRLRWTKLGLRLDLFGGRQISEFTFTIMMIFFPDYFISLLRSLMPATCEAAPLSGSWPEFGSSLASAPFSQENFAKKSISNISVPSW